MYGNPKTHTGTTMYQGMTWRRRIRIERAARLTATGLFSNEQIAQQMGINPQTLVHLKQTKAFQNAMIEIKTGIISQENLEVARVHEAQREELADMVPMALMNLRKFALSSNPVVALKANLEILDRDGNHSKVSRTSVVLDPSVDLDSVNAVGNNILNVLKGVASASENQSAADGFTVSAAAAGAQVNIMAESITEKTLEEIDLSKATKQ